MEVIGGLGVIGFVVLIIMVCSIYAGQKWAYKCFKELEKINAKMGSVNIKVKSD